MTPREKLRALYHHYGDGASIARQLRRHKATVSRWLRRLNEPDEQAEAAIVRLYARIIERRGQP